MKKFFFLIFALFFAFPVFAWDNSGSFDMSPWFVSGVSCDFASSGDGVVVNGSSFGMSTCVISDNGNGTFHLSTDGYFQTNQPISALVFNSSETSLYEGLFDNVLNVIISLLIIIIPYSLGIFAIYLAIKVCKFLFKLYMEEPEDIKYARKIREETDRLLKGR